ncbi:hypothetical protein SynBIOSE41_02333 [Synechococcus sp. BIOS-E4-1]|nr:hypothetical protein SynBIOSE41_02333 [Synechococcus sp. BIOS-E4-1]
MHGKIEQSKYSPKTLQHIFAKNTEQTSYTCQQSKSKRS